MSTRRLGNAAHDLCTGVDAGNIGGVVERGKGDAVFNGFHHLFVIKTEEAKARPVNDAVPHSADFGHAAHNAVFLAGEFINDSCDGLGVGGRLTSSLKTACAHQGGVLKVSVKANALAKALARTDSSAMSNS